MVILEHPAQIVTVLREMRSLDEEMGGQLFLLLKTHPDPRVRKEVQRTLRRLVPINLSLFSKIMRGKIGTDDRRLSRRLHRLDAQGFPFTAQLAAVMARRAPFNVHESTPGMAYVCEVGSSLARRTLNAMLRDGTIPPGEPEYNHHLFRAGTLHLYNVDHLPPELEQIPVRHLFLRESRLTQLPSLALPQLVSLQLWSVKIKSLASIGRLEGLEDVRLVDLPLTSLPGCLFSLPGLRHLEIIRLNRLRQLPDNVAQAIQLQHLTINQAARLRTLPAALASMEALSHLSINLPYNSQCAVPLEVRLRAIHLRLGG